jgi:hypothetical protein
VRGTTCYLCLALIGEVTVGRTLRVYEHEGERDEKEGEQAEENDGEGAHFLRGPRGG